MEIEEIALNHETFKRLLKESGLTQEEFAEEVDICTRYVRNLLKTDKNISVALAYRMSKTFNCSIESLLRITKLEF